jgi:DNA-3-methyladenine glycosylase
VVETEAYAAEGDPACHTFFRQGARRFVASHRPGTAYVYFNYGMHWLFNVLVKGPEGDGFVLFRALEPLEGLELMRRRRGVARPEALCSGPAKLTQALRIDGRHHGRPFLALASRGLWAGGEPAVLVAGPRVGISRGRELPWRFRLAGSPFTSGGPAAAGSRAEA